MRTDEKRMRLGINFETSKEAVLTQLNARATYFVSMITKYMPQEKESGEATRVADRMHIA